MSEISIIEPVANVLKAYSSITGNDMEARLALFSAVATSELLTTVLDKELELKDVVIEPSEFTNEVTGEASIEPRVTLVMADGKSYRGTSVPLHRDIVRMLAIVGEPSAWTRPLKIVIAREGKAPASYLTLKSVK